MPLIFLLALLSTELPSTIFGLIPEACVYNVSMSYGVCCPIDPNNGMACGGPERGYCEDIVPPLEYVPEVFLQDDRISWPLRYFNRACQCKGHYFGVSCEGCWLGWAGPHCDRPVHRVRRDISKLSQREIDLIKDVVQISQSWPSGFYVLDESTNLKSDPINNPGFIPASVQYYITFLHRFGSRPTLYNSEEACSKYGLLNFNHDGAVFPTWHRYFNLLWERMLAQIAFEVYGVEDFTLPYWDLIGLKHCDICIDEVMGAPGMRSDDGLHLSMRSRLYNLTQYCLEPKDGPMCYGCQRMSRSGFITREFNSFDFPDQRDLEFVMGLQRYFVPDERENEECLSFHMALEGFCGRPGADPSLLWMHNKVHRMIDGSMCCTATSTNDPIFLVLHNLVDKIFNTWLRLHKAPLSAFPESNVRPGHSRESFLIGLLPLARNSDMFVESSALGYDFDDQIFGKHAENGLPPLDYS